MSPDHQLVVQDLTACPSLRCHAPSRGRRRPSCCTRPQSRCPLPRDRASRCGQPPIGRTPHSRLGQPRGVVVALDVPSLTSALAGLAFTASQMHAVDDLAVGVELEVAIGRTAVVGAYGVYGGLRSGPQLLAGGEVERRETTPTVDPPEPGPEPTSASANCVPPDHLPWCRRPGPGSWCYWALGSCRRSARRRPPVPYTIMSHTSVPVPRSSGAMGCTVPSASRRPPGSTRWPRPCRRAS